MLVPSAIESQHGPVDLSESGDRVGENPESIQVLGFLFEDGARFLPSLLSLTRVEIKSGKFYAYVGVVGIELGGALKVAEGGPELSGFRKG